MAGWEQVEVSLDVKGETLRAFRCSQGDEQDIWIPKSQIDNLDEIEVGACSNMFIPAWLAKEKGLI